MVQTIMKYNPAFLKPGELVASFVVRHKELDTIIQIIKENVTKSNQHILVIGPRGIGKTTLLLRTVEEIRRKKNLNKKWYPLVFSEESYSVVTCGEFWLESLLHLAHQTKDDKWQKTYDELIEEKEEKRLRERALAQLLDFADKQGKRIILVVENLNMLLGDQMSDKEGWALRHTLLNESRVMLLASATSRFEQIDVESKPMFELFRFLELKPLTSIECRELWASVTGNKPDDALVRPLEILTGGNPRLMAIVSNFASKVSLKNLMNDLMQLVDEHTEYFKSHLDNLPAVERKAYLALAEIWDPATAREVAESARLEVSMTSALLRRLMERGAVVEANGKGRAKLYQVAERMYNVYYLMRKRGDASRRVRAVVNFMTSFYAAEELVTVAKGIAEEACQLPPTERFDHLMAYIGIIRYVKSSEALGKIVGSTPRAFLEVPGIRNYVRDILDKTKTREELRNLLKKIAEEIAEEIIDIFKGNDISTKPLQKLEEAEKQLRDFVNAHSNSFSGWCAYGACLHLLDRVDEAEKAYREVLRIAPRMSLGWEFLGYLLMQRGRYSEAEKALRKVIELNYDDVFAWGFLGFLLKVGGRHREAEEALEKAIEFDKDRYSLMLILILPLILSIEGDDSRSKEWQELLREFIKRTQVFKEKYKETEKILMPVLMAISVNGHEREIVEIIKESTWAEALEPLVVALRMMQGEEVKAAAEIMEVAKDVVKRIEDNRRQIESAKKDEVKK